MFFKEIKNRPAVFDGAFGTMVQMSPPDEKDYGDLPQINEVLCITSPALIASIHNAYLKAGCDIITTNTFGASRIVLAEQGLEDRVQEINTKAAKIARASADAVIKIEKRPVFVAGELGPTSKLPSLGHISFFELEDTYCEQAGFLISNGVDLLMTATSQDPLQVKAALSGARLAMRKAGREVPVIVSVTVEANGSMLVGTTLAAMLASIEPYGPAAFGINCALGPDLMEEHIAEISQLSPFPIICQPNAGLPENREGKPFYPLGPGKFSSILGSFADKYGIEIVGGCCGTTPGHIAELRKRVEKIDLKKRRLLYTPACSSLFSRVSLDQTPKPFIIAEQTNANGSKKFRDMVSTGDWHGCLAIAREASEGAHAIDLSISLPMRNETEDMHKLVPEIVRSLDIPIMIDSTNPSAIEAALSHIGGRAIINSINLEDGGAKAKKILSLAKRFGAVVVGLTIDENGMAVTASKKLEIAERIVNLAKDEGLRAQDIIIDPLVFTLASGAKETENSGIETLKAVKLIKDALPEVRVSLGISNVSFGLPPKGRKALTSYFLTRAVSEGLDAAIINAKKIEPIHNIDSGILPWVERLVNNDKSKGSPIESLLEKLGSEEKKAERAAQSAEKKSPEELLSSKILNGDRSDLEKTIESVLKKFSAKEIVNGILMEAMKDVGERFGAGSMPLPFVLKSAETMRAAINILKPNLSSDDTESRGTIVLATVRGDVHDIGKNLVDAILSNNGFKVVNLGIKQSAANVIEAVKKHNADAIGLSGLLVSSMEVMREDLEVFRHNNLRVPVLCGGAALTERFTKEVLSKEYPADVFYCADAFAGLKNMEKVCDKQQSS